MRTALLTLAAAAALAASAGAQAKANFSGTWTLNVEKSDPPLQGPGGGRQMATPGPQTLTQTADKLVIEIKGTETTRTLTYLLDGKESTNPGMPGAETKSTAKWEGESLVIASTTSMSGPNGDVTITAKEVRSLSADGKTMTVVTTSQSPMGERTTKRVYDKQ